jgi:hypothetical protein
LTTPEGFLTHSEYENPKHPPDKEYRDDGSRDVNDPVARCFRFPKIEHAAMVAGLPRRRRYIVATLKIPIAERQADGATLRY